MTGCVSIYVTVESEDVAVHMATALVREKLIACANISPDIRSIYEWDGLIQLDREVSLILKTTEDKQEEAVERIAEMHNYDVPCITVSPITNGNAKYLEWVKQKIA